MSISSVGATMPQYQVPKSPQAKIDDERTESVAAKMREDATGKDVAVPVKNKTSQVDMKA